MSALGPIGRLGRWSATHARIVFIAWAVVVVGLGVLAPRVETALSGAGWEDSGSQSVAARDLIQRDFAGNASSGLMVVVHSPTLTTADPAFASAIARSESTLRADPRVASVSPPRRGATISADGHTAIVMAGSATDPMGMVRAADDLKGPLRRASTDQVSVNLTGASGMWSDFNTANRDAMMRSELISWPVTLAILVLAFGALVAAGLPLLLTILGLASSAGALFLASQVFEVSIWAMNFALMFALALGIDYALFIVVRFRGALFGSKRPVVDAVAETMDTAGKAVLFSGITVLISLSAVMLVPSPAFRSMALGIMISVAFILAATLTLLPAVLAQARPQGGQVRPPVGPQRRAPLRALRRLGRAPLAPAGALRAPRPAGAAGAGDPGRRPDHRDAVDQGRPLGRLLAPGLRAGLGGLRPGGARHPPAGRAGREHGGGRVDRGGRSRHRPGAAAPGGRRGHGARAGRPAHRTRPTRPPGATIDRLRADLPSGVLVGGAAAENHDLAAVLTTYTPLVIGVVLLLGFVLLIVALQAPVVAAIGVLTSLLATGAAFGVARLIFQDGHLSSLLGFESQGFLDAWGPVFFFAMIFAISMDYTVFLLSSAKEHWDRSHDAREAAVGGMAHSGRVILAAGAVMVAVFFTFALSGPLPPKEMGVILGVAVLLDALVVRLLLVPVALRLAGRWAWWRPEWLHRLLPEVRFGH